VTLESKEKEKSIKWRWREASLLYELKARLVEEEGEILLREGIIGFIFVPWREKKTLWVPPRDRTRAREWFRHPDRDWNLVEAEFAVVRLYSLL